ncbi:MAG: TraR/DksA C4-type zinc finger protein [Desulfobacterales bacterium]
MKDKEAFSEIRENLLDRRRELIDLRRSLDESWQRLHEPEKELEETASKATMSRGMEQRSETIQAEIRNIDNALTKMEEGDYGRCEACRRPINLKRLRAIPWTRYCVQCASVRETLSPGGVDSQAVETGGAALTDEEMIDAILDELQSDGRIEREELDISCEDGVVYLEGVLPSEARHQILLEILNDVLDFNEVVDDISIDRQLWERIERRPDEKSGDERVEELAGEEEEGEVDVQTSLETGEPMTPPDEFIPEKPE